jgi:hypothetical protein
MYPIYSLHLKLTDLTLSAYICICIKIWKEYEFLHGQVSTKFVSLVSKKNSFSGQQIIQNANYNPMFDSLNLSGRQIKKIQLKQNMVPLFKNPASFTQPMRDFKNLVQTKIWCPSFFFSNALCREL